MSESRVAVDTVVVVDITDESVITRCTENHDELGVPRPSGFVGENGERGWRDNFYDLRTREDVLQMLAFNCVANGVEHVNRLDGWADCSDEAATMHVDRSAFYASVPVSENTRDES